MRLPMAQKTKNGFSMHAKRFFLTYPKTPKRLSPQRLLSYLSTKGNILRAVISQELHKDGSYHLHAIVEFDTRLNVRNARFFDLPYYGRQHHPNVQKVRSWQKASYYIRKDGSYISVPDEDANRMWWEIALEAPTYADFLKAILVNNPNPQSYVSVATAEKLWREVRFL